MKTLLSGFLFSLLTVFGVSSQNKQQDSIAILILDRMTDVIGDLESCSFRLNTSADVPDLVFGQVKQLSVHDVYMSGPNKMLVDIHGRHGHQQIMYNGHELVRYSFDEHNYGILPAPETTIQTIDTIHADYGIEFPAADFFYPTFTDDLLNESDIVKFAGIVRIEDKEYFHIIASATDKKIELWISNDAFTLPAKYAITYTTQKNNPQYDAVFSNWQINPTLPAAIFDFLPPAGSNEVRILAKHEQ